MPVAPGVALIGDAAGHNDPTIGQGLSIAMRDARLVAEAVSGAPDDDMERLANYATERRERMRRLRQTGRLASKYRCEFGAEADQVRAAISARIAKDPGAGLPLLVPFLGSFGVPAETFAEAAIRRLFGNAWRPSTAGWLERERQA